MKMSQYFCLPRSCSCSTSVVRISKCFRISNALVLEQDDLINFDILDLVLGFIFSPGVQLAVKFPIDIVLLNLQGFKAVFLVFKSTSTTSTLETSWFLLRGTDDDSLALKRES